MSDVTIVASPTAAHQRHYGDALEAGLKRIGVNVARARSHALVRTAVVACWGWRIGRQHRAMGREVLVMERGYIGDRFKWTSLGWNGLNGRARFADVYDDGSRFASIWGHLMQPFDPSGEYALLIGQVPGDAALNGKNMDHWYADTARRAASFYGLPVVFRPHPIVVKRGQARAVPGTKTMNGDLAVALMNAAIVITWNSNTAVESVLAGKPTIAMDEGSMAWPVAAHDIGPIELKDRADWAQRLACKQFCDEEIANGSAVTPIWCARDRALKAA